MRRRPLRRSKLRQTARRGHSITHASVRIEATPFFPLKNWYGYGRTGRPLPPALVTVRTCTWPPTIDIHTKTTYWLSCKNCQNLSNSEGAKTQLRSKTFSACVCHVTDETVTPIHKRLASYPGSRWASFPGPAHLSVDEPVHTCNALLISPLRKKPCRIAR